MNALGIPEQRTALHDCIVANTETTVEKYPRKDPVPPVIMIGDPRIDFPENSMVGIVQWAVQMFATRQAPAAVSAGFDVELPKLLLALSHGLGMGFKLLRVENQVVPIEGYPLPGYTIIGSAPLANC